MKNGHDQVCAALTKAGLNLESEACSQVRFVSEELSFLSLKPREKEWKLG